MYDLRMDFFDDPNMLSNLSSIVALPDYVAEQVVLEQQDIPSEDYAVVFTLRGQMYPKFSIHNKAFSWLSLMYAICNFERIPEKARRTVFTNILRACRHHEIDITTLAANILGLEDEKVTGNQVALPEQLAEKVADVNEFAFVDGETKKLPIGDKDQIARSVESFNSNYYKIPPLGTRREIACNIKLAADRHGVQVDGLCEIYASNYLNSDFANEMSKRANILSQDKGSQKEIQGLLKLFSEEPEIDVLLEKVAAFDQEHKIDKLWDGGLKDPYLTVLGLPEIPKVAAYGRKYSEQDILKIAEEQEERGKFTNRFLKHVKDNPLSAVEEMDAAQKALFFGKV